MPIHAGDHLSGTVDEPDAGSITVDGSRMVLTGDIDHEVVREWRRANPDHPRVTAIHADGATFFGSAGVALVVQLIKQAAPTRVLLDQPSRPVLRPLQAIGVDQMLDIAT